jgi:hypothetical protein
MAPARKGGGVLFLHRVLKRDAFGIIRLGAFDTARSGLLCGGIGPCADQLSP